MTFRGPFRPHLNPRAIGLVVGLITVVGLSSLLISRAATPFLSLEPESGALNGMATPVTDPTASGGKAIRFNTTTTHTFVHPGITISKTDLDFVRSKVTAHAEPWTSELQFAASSSYASTSRAPSPMTDLSSSALEATFMNDAQTAYTNALLWYYTGNTAYATQAIRYLNAYATTHTRITFKSSSGSVVYGNGVLDAAWGAELWPRTAEIIRYSDAGWSPADATRFETYLKNVYQQLLIDGWTNGGNWQSSIAEGLINIGVYNNDEATYQAGLSRWKDKIVTSIYLTTDGQYPIPPSSTYKRPGDSGWNATNDIGRMWSYPARYVDGLVLDTCRDLSHAAMNLAAVTAGAETAYIQGDDLYTPYQSRLQRAIELQAGWINAYFDEVHDVANTVVGSNWMPANNWPCRWFMTDALNNTTPVQNPKNNAGGGALSMGWDIGFNHYAQRKGISMPQTRILVDRVLAHKSSAGTYRVGNHVAWTTLTHTGAP